LVNKPQSIPTEEEIQAEKEKLERERITLNAILVTSGRELGISVAGAQLDHSSPAFDLPDSAAHEFAALVDYLRDYRDCAELYSEVQKLDVYAELQGYIDTLAEAGISLCYATRHTKIVGRNWVDKTPWPVTVFYLSAFKKGSEPKQFLVPRSIQIGS
jgi:hypothetical protein